MADRPGAMREQMPETAAFIDALREAFGAEAINGQIRRGMKGEPVFHAREGGFEIGTPLPPRTVVKAEYWVPPKGQGDAKNR